MYDRRRRYYLVGPAYGEKVCLSKLYSKYDRSPVYYTVRLPYEAWMKKKPNLDIPARWVVCCAGP